MMMSGSGIKTLKQYLWFVGKSCGNVQWHTYINNDQYEVAEKKAEED